MTPPPKKKKILIVDILVNEIWSVSRLLVLGILPTLWVSFLNWRIYQKVLQSSSSSVQLGLRRNVTTNNGEVLAKKTDNIQFFTLLSIVIIFLICSIPRIIILMHEAVIIDTIKCCISAQRVGAGFPVWNLILGKFSEIFLIVNPSLNFLVYSVVNLKFRYFYF